MWIKVQQRMIITFESEVEAETFSEAASIMEENLLEVISELPMVDAVEPLEPELVSQEWEV